MKSNTKARASVSSSHRFSVCLLLTAGLLFSGPACHAAFNAYNDLNLPAGEIGTFITTYSPAGTTSGALVDYDTGGSLPAQVSIGGVAPAANDATYTLPTGSDAYSNFNGKVDCSSYCNWGSGDVTLTFSGLDSAQRYEFVLFASRCAESLSYSNRYTQSVISGADSFTNASTIGTTILTTSSNTDTTRVIAGNVDGKVVRYVGINPGSDGTFAVTLSPGTLNSGITGASAYINAFALSELGTSTVAVVSYSLPVITNHLLLPFTTDWGDYWTAGTPHHSKSVWQYRYNGADPGSAWSTNYSFDGSWPSGMLSMAANMGTGGVGTLLSQSGMPSSHTHYFRYAFDVPDASRIDVGTIICRIRGGAKVYLNGVEILSTNLPPVVDHNTWANSASVDNLYNPIPFNGSLLKSGMNILAAEIHNWQGDSQIFWDCYGGYAENEFVEGGRAAMSNGTLSMQWGVTSSRRHRLEYKTALTSSVWQVYSTNLTSTSDTVNVDTPLSGASRFYRMTEEPLASTPPMGWNSWDAYGESVTESEVRSNANYMASNMLSHGWEYVVLDIRWYISNPSAVPYQQNAMYTYDAYGRFMPPTNRFPSAMDGQGFKALADYLHSKGLKFGLHLMRGIPRIAVQQNLPINGSVYHAADVAIANPATPGYTDAWIPDMYTVNMTHPGGQDWYDSWMRQLAGWGVDFIKVDNLSSSPYSPAEIEAIRKALNKTGRPIVFSMSPGVTPPTESWHAAAYSTMWRINGDFWDNWTALKNSFAMASGSYVYIGPGHWPDLDMLPLGRIGIRAEVGTDRMTAFTHDEQYTMMTLWSIARSPLMFGGDLPSNDAFTLGLLTNDEILAVNRNSTNNRPVRDSNGLVVWAANVPGSANQYVALLNNSDGSASVGVAFTNIGINTSCAVRDLWARQDLGVFSASLSRSIPAHGAGLYKLNPQ